MSHRPLHIACTTVRSLQAQHTYLKTYPFDVEIFALTVALGTMAVAAKVAGSPHSGQSHVALEDEEGLTAWPHVAKPVDVSSRRPHPYVCRSFPFHYSSPWPQVCYVPAIVAMLLGILALAVHAGSRSGLWTGKPFPDGWARLQRFWVFEKPVTHSSSRCPLRQHKHSSRIRDWLAPNAETSKSPDDDEHTPAKQSASAPSLIRLRS